MTSFKKTKEQQITELKLLRNRIAELEKELESNRELCGSLKEREQQLSSLSEATFEGIAITEKGVIIYSNQQFADMFGYNQAELIKKRVIDLVATEHHDLVLQHIKEGYEEAYEFIGLKNDGSRIYLEVRGRQVQFQGRLVRESVIRDITERKHAEEEIRLHSAILKNMTEGVCLVRTSDAVIVYANEKFEKMFGYGPSELNNQPVTIVNYEANKKNAEKVRDEIIEQLTQRGEAKYEVRNVKKDGTPFWCLAHTSTITLPGYGEVWVAVHTDINEHKRAENQTLEQRNLFETILNSSPDLIVLKDQKSVYQSVNSAFCEFIGRPKSEIIGRTDYDLFPAEEAEMYVSDDAKVMETGQPQILDEEVTGNEGIKWLQVAKTPVRNIKNDITGILCSVRDITERKKAEETLQRAHNELELRVKDRTLELQEKNIALKVLLKQREEDKNELEQNILSNLKSLIQPYIRKLKRNNSNLEDVSYLNIIESNLEDIISPFSQKLSSKYLSFTSKEIAIANLIKEGKKDKEIMEIMNLAFDTVKGYRKNIRKKLGIHGTETNLRTKLLSM